MSMKRMWLLGLSLAAVLAVGTVVCPAEEPKPMTAEQKEAALADLTLAYEIADAGRKASSPEALLAAAKILSRLNREEIGLIQLEGVKPVKFKTKDKDRPKTGEAIKEDGKAVSLTDEIKKLKEDAHKLNKPRDEKLAEMIDSVDEKARGSLRGPAWINGQSVGAGDSTSFVFNFYGKSPARVLVRNRSGALLTLEIYNKEGALIGSRTGRGNLEINWTPVFTRAFDVYVNNEGARGEAEFDIFKN